MPTNRDKSNISSLVEIVNKKQPI